jgi:hypothetical protein
MAAQQHVPWYKLDKVFSGLATNVQHEILVQREAIPIIFVPGVMGSRLRKAGTGKKVDKNGADGLPNLRWEPTKDAKGIKFLYDHYSGRTPAHRKQMLIGKVFSPAYLEVDDADPVGDGFQGIMGDYCGFLQELRTRDWGELGKIFVFPVYAFGYNWTDSNRCSALKLAGRIKEIIAEARQQVGLCKKAILLTHSMGGLVARAACGLGKAEADVLGVIHGVQPAFGAAAAYWRMKAGFEAGSVSSWIASRFLGPTGRDVTALLAGCPGGLQLLPTWRYGTSWLSIQHGREFHNLPKFGDPFREIYCVPAEVNPPAGSGPSNNTYWGLVDKNLLSPDEQGVRETPGNDLDQLADRMRDPEGPWNDYLKYLGEAKSFHSDVGEYVHPRTLRFHGKGLPTAHTVTLQVESNWVRSENYPTRGFRGFFRGPNGASMQAVLQDPRGDGDGTVPTWSATMGGAGHTCPGEPAAHGFESLEHQPAYQQPEVQKWVISAITALCHERYKEQHG